VSGVGGEGRRYLLVVGVGDGFDDAAGARLGNVSGLVRGRAALGRLLGRKGIHVVPVPVLCTFQQRCEVDILPSRVAKRGCLDASWCGGRLLGGRVWCGDGVPELVVEIGEQTGHERRLIFNRRWHRDTGVTRCDLTRIP